MEQGARILTSMAQDELALRQLLAQGLRQSREPSLANTGLLHNELKLLVVDVDAVQVGVEHELREVVRDRRRVLRGRVLRLAECGHDEGHARAVVLLLELLTLVSGQRSPLRDLVGGATGQEEGQVTTRSSQYSVFASRW